MVAPRAKPRLPPSRTIPRWSACLLTGATLLINCGQHSDDDQNATSGGRSGNGAGGSAGLSGATHGGASGASAGASGRAASGASGASSEAGSPDSGSSGNGCATVGATPSPDDPTDTPAPDQALGAQTHSFFKITVRDSASGAAIPGAELSTVNSIVYTSDVNGVVAFYEPGMMGLTVFFSVSHPGFQAAADGFGVRGKALLASEGGSAEILLDKTTGSAVPVSSDLATRLVAQPVPRRSDCFAIRLFDQDNLRGVPLARLSAFGEDYWSDSQGMIAYCNPDHLGAQVTFDFFSHGYTLSAGTATVTLSADRGGTGALKLRRTNIAERLYRLTGGGIDRDSVLLGLKTPLGNPTLAGQVLGQDTASTALYKGQLFWVWGDTNRVSYVLGNFHGTSATSLLPAAGGLSPDRGVDLHYFVGADGFAAPMCTDCPGGPAWFAALVSVPDANQNEKLFAGYGIANSDLTFKETGLAELDDASLTFERVITDFKDRPNFTRPDGHPFKLRHGQQTYVYYGALRIPASADAFLDPSRYEQFTPYGPAGSSALQYDADGHLSYAYRAGGLTPDSAQLTSAGVPASQDPSGHDLSVADGSALDFTPRAVTWNAYRKRFVGTAQQIGGSSSYIGEIWHSEADTPVGPWVYAQKIISHDNYTFYNTFHHPEFDRDRFLYLEGTYTASFANDPTPTPRYDYNQILYRVDLEDPRLVLPVAIYDLGGALPGDFVTKLGLTPGADPIQPVFLAPDRPLENSVAVAWSGPACQTGRTLVVGNAPTSAPLFYALPPDLAPPPPHTVPLYDYVSKGGLHAYSLSDDRVPAGFTRVAAPIALVAENPIALKFPVADYLGDLIARAGADQCLSANPGGTSVLLDASASLATGGKIVHYFWHLPPGAACESVEGQRVTVTLPPGLFSIELEIQDDTGNVSRDTLLVSIQ